MSDPREIAAKLTKAQREAVRAMDLDSPHYPKWLMEEQAPGVPSFSTLGMQIADYLERAALQEGL
jgi:hypothetical protein